MTASLIHVTLRWSHSADCLCNNLLIEIALTITR